MKSNNRQPIVLHQLPILPEPQLRSLIIKLLPSAELRGQDILLRRKEGKYQAFLMIPSLKVEEICSLKQLNNANDKIFIRKWYSNYQVFVGRLPQTLSLNQVITEISTQFGKIIRYQQVKPHQGSKNKFRVLYLQFENEENAEKCLFSNHKFIVKNFELRVARPYAFGENEETDKKLFIKVMNATENCQDLEISLNSYFRKEGKLREKIRLEGGNGPIIFTSAQIADRVLKNFKSVKIDKWDILLRPFASFKDNYTAFIANVNPSLSQAQLQEYLYEYQPIISCKIHPSSSKICNATVTFALDQSFKRILAEFKTNQKLRPIFNGVTPYVTIHMSAKERNDYNNFKRGSDKVKGPSSQSNRPMIMGFPNQEQPFGMFPQQSFGYGFPPQMPMGMGMPMGNMRVLPTQYRK